VRRATATISSLALYDGIERVLQEYSDRDVPLGVCTSLPGSIALPLLEAAELYAFFGGVAHAGNCPARKPHPDGILRVLSNLGVQPSPSVFYVGDRDVDSRTAANAQISFAWAAYGYVDAEPRFVTARILRPEQLLAL
jgi:phosphoglycolate phosphatase